MCVISRLGGPDPLDYISMYDHPGIPELHIPPHWHYIRYFYNLCLKRLLSNFLSFSFGLTDLHGDGRVHEPTGPELPSGFGFELTFRLIKSPTSDNPSPPTWPAALLQALAKYGIYSNIESFSSKRCVQWKLEIVLAHFSFPYG